mgnify:CR=1 FL=1
MRPWLASAPRSAGAGGATPPPQVGVLTLQPSNALTLEGGLEGAFNFLSAKTAITEDGRPVPIPNANVRVEEKRGEAFANAVWKPSSRLSVDARLGLEASEISQSGDTNLARTFYFPKPRLLVAWAPTGASQLRFRFERELGQLDFGDFAASAELSDDQVFGGTLPGPIWRDAMEIALKGTEPEPFEIVQVAQ